MNELVSSELHTGVARELGQLVHRRISAEGLMNTRVFVVNVDAEHGDHVKSISPIQQNSIKKWLRRKPQLQQER